MEVTTLSIFGYSFLCAVVAGKWGLELGVSQFRQILIMVGGAILGPLMLLILYLYLLRQRQENGEPGSQLI